MEFLLYLIPLLHLAGLVSAFHAIMSTRTAQGSVAWVMSLVTFPYLAVPAYWVFGRNKFQGYVLARRAQLQVVHDRLKDATEAVRKKAEIDNVDPGNLRGAEELARMPATAKNKIDLLVDGEATFGSILTGIDAAKEYVLVQFYIVRDDGIGRDLKNRLIERANAGVKVCFVYDEIGSLGLPESFLDEMRAAGVDARPFNTRKGALNRFQLNFRNHRKIVVVDGKVCWIGGLNVGDEYLGKDPKVGKWRDTHLRIEGPATLAAQVSFVEDWQWASDSVPEDLRWEPHELDDGDSAVLVTPSGPADPFETASLLHMQAINTARTRLWIATPYFVPDQGIIAAIQLARLRGVDVRVIIPDKTDNWLVTMASYVYFQEIVGSGVRFFRYTNGFMHQKVFLIDDRVAAVGTANFDNRSFRLNFEVTATGVGAAYFAEVEAMLENDFKDSVEMAPDAFTSRPFWFRLAARFCRLSSPVL